MKAVRIVVLAAALGWLLLAVRTCVVWEAPSPTHGAAKLLPGTDLASAEVPSISLSPDDRWLVFSEYSAKPPEVYELRLRDRYAVASVDLVANSKSSHLDTVQCARRPFSYQTVGAEGSASWQGDVFLLHKCDNRGHYVAMRAGQPQLELIARSAEPLTCSDCEPPPSATQSIEWPRHLVNHYSFTADGSAVYYERDGVRMADASQDGRVVVGEFSKSYLGMTTQFAQLRVSPDQHYLAYCVFYSLNVPIIPGSGWVQYLYLKNLKSGREARIAARFSLSNLVWSHDSRRLYFAGIECPKSGQVGPLAGGIYVMDAHDVFGED